MGWRICFQGQFRSQKPGSQVPGMVWIRKIRWVTQLKRICSNKNMETYIPCVRYMWNGWDLFHILYVMFEYQICFALNMIKLKSKELAYLLYRCLQELTSSSQRTGPRHRARKHSENSSVSIFQFNSLFLYTYSRSYFTWVLLFIIIIIITSWWFQPTCR